MGVPARQPAFSSSREAIRTIALQADIDGRVVSPRCPAAYGEGMQRLFALPCRTAAITVALALCAVAPAAAETIAPPGNSGVDQYMEVVPSAQGPAAPGTPQRALLSAVQRKLQSQGAEGRQLAQIVKATTRSTHHALAAQASSPSPAGERGRRPAGAPPFGDSDCRRRQGHRRRRIGRDGSRAAAAAGREPRCRRARAVASP